MFSIVAAVAFAALPVVDSIHIEWRWSSLGDETTATYTIVRRDNRYDRTDATVRPKAVDRFVAAITAGPVDRKTALVGLANPDWLAARANESEPDVALPVCSPEAKRLLQQHLTDPEEAVSALDQYFSIGWTDDSPFLSIDVTFHDRRAVHLESHAQHALMLPWRIGSGETWNPDIPRAIVDLLPKDAVPRLTDTNLDKAYVDEVAMGMHASIDDLEERCIHRHFLAAVEKQFEVVRIYHGAPGWFTAYVRRADFPPNLLLTLVIRGDDEPDAQSKLQRAVQRTPAYIALVRDYVVGHSEKRFTIWCADGVSVDGDESAVSLSEYDPASGTVSHPRIVHADGTVTDDGV